MWKFAEICQSSFLAEIKFISNNMLLLSLFANSRLDTSFIHY